MFRMLRLILTSLLLVACGDGRTDLGEVVYLDGDAASGDATSDVHSIVHPRDASPDAPSPGCGFDGDPSPPGTHPYGICGEGVNTDYPPTMNCGGTSEAFEYVPQKTFAVARIELFTNRNVAVALLDSDCEKPGTLIYEGTLDGPPSGAQWRGINPTNPITVIANHRYFIWMDPASGGTMCSAAANGAFVREYTSQNASGPWDGPYSGIYWMARLIGKCQ